MNPLEMMTQDVNTQNLINIGLMFISFLITFIFLNSVIVPYIQENQRLKRRFKLTERGAKRESNSLGPSKDALQKGMAGKKQLEEILKHSKSSGIKMYNFLYRSGLFSNFMSYFVLFVFFFTLSVAFTHLSIKMSPYNSLLTSGIIASLFFFLFLRWCEYQWTRKFKNQFPIALAIITRTLKAGLSLSRGIALAAEELPSPLKDEFDYMSAQFQIGTTGKKVFTEASGRINVDNFRFFSIAILVQTEMGGGLLDILLKLSKVIKEKERLLKKVAILSAESKTTTWIITSLPFFVAVALEYINPGYLSFFIKESVGNIMLAFLFFSTILSILIIRNMTDFENL